ncbi:PREDICTED: venom serine carboxypeptidase [Nicrophorus vespilloides]|uniref:Carboxypeptidase n=1 Tax=Nicrophorus vespilloides TaxID=110193 RepID=A0ABM1MA34_NICVS|nr:PREDICTED: venom serine carboxypeptidase [Nicrophorus vespilloides]
MKPTVLLLLFALIYNVESFMNVYRRIATEESDGDAGDPLFLTPLIEQGKVKEAQDRAKVQFPGFKGVQSYAGYYTVNKAKGSNQFLWYFPAKYAAKTSPVVLWLQGGPGATSLIGLFTENGPFKATKNGIELRKFTWSMNHHLIFIDNPVGTGYSFTKNGYAKNESDVGRDLYSTLTQFFTMFPSLQNNDFYIAGESYAGKYVPAIGYTIYKNNPSAKLKINLKGLSIGNGLSDPEHQLKYSDYLYQLGLIDDNMKKTVKSYEKQGVEYIQNKQWVEAFQLFDNLLNGDLNNHTSIFKNATGFENYFNYLVAEDLSKDIEYMGKFIQSTAVRKALHVGNIPFNGIGQEVEVNLMEDVMQSVAPWISELLSHYPVLIYNGQLDIIVAYPLTINYLNNLDFSAAEEYKTAKRYIWKVNGDIAGYVKHAGNLTEVLVRNAGHMVPTDQPLWAFDLITRFTHKKKLY